MHSAMVIAYLNLHVCIELPFECLQAVGRLGGNNMLDECKELRRINLGQSTVPWNIRGKGQS